MSTSVPLPSSSKGVMGKKSNFTRITPLPSHVPRQLVLDMLQSHEEVIRLNPLVTDVKSIEPPREAPSEEYFSSWYEIYETVPVSFGYKKKISFKTVFHDHPWGTQTHAYAPFGVDLRNKYRVGGNQPGEPREVKELGVETPLDGLYIREDVEIICNIPLTTKLAIKETKSAIGIMVDRIIRKAELLDEGKLHAMFEHGKLKTAKPDLNATYDDRSLPSPNIIGSSPPGSPAPSRYSVFSDGLKSPPLDSKGFGRYRDIGRDGSMREGSVRSNQYIPSYQQTGYGGPQHANGGAELPGNGAPTAFVSELPASMSFEAQQYPPQQQQQPQYGGQQQYPDQHLYPQPLKFGGGGAVFRSELPGDYQLPSRQSSPALPQNGQTQDIKTQPPPAALQPTEQAPPVPQRSPQQSPPPAQLVPGGPPPAQRASSNGSNYRVANPDRNSSGQPKQRDSSSSVQQWQQSVQSDPPIDDSYYRNARSSQGAVEQLPSQQRHSSQEQQQRLSWQRQQQQQPIQSDHQQFSRMTVQDTGVQGAGRISRCPVCDMFEGDPDAVSHHVSDAHFK